MGLNRSETNATSAFIAAIAAIPLVFLPNPTMGAEAVYLVPKLMVLAIVVGPLALVLARRSAVDARAIALPIALVLWMVAISFTHHDIRRSLMGSSERLDGAFPHVGLLMAVVGGAAVARLGGRDALARAVAIAGAVVAGIVMAQWVGFPSLASQAASATLTDMPGATIGNRGYCACFLAGVLPLVIRQAKASSTNRSRRLWTACVFGVGLAIGLGWTRGASLATLAGLVVLVAVASKWRVAAAGFALLAVAGLAIGTFTAQPASDGDKGHAFSTTDSGRKPLYRAALWGIRHRPVTGYGAGGVLLAMADAPPADVLRWAGRTGQQARLNPATNPRQVLVAYNTADGAVGVYQNITSKAHNELLDYGVSYGAPAAILAALTVVVALWRTRRDATVAAAIVSFTAGLLTWPQVMRTAPVFWAMLGVALATTAARSSAAGQVDASPA